MDKKRDYVKWAIIDDEVKRLVIVSKTDERYVGRAADGKEYVVSKYDAYKTLHEAIAALNEELPS